MRKDEAKNVSCMTRDETWPTKDIVLSQPVFNFQKLYLPSTSTGPEAIAFGPIDPFSGDLYTGISDGRIVKYNTSTFIEVYITSPNRSSVLCDGTNIAPILGPICGRPIDAYKGFLMGGKEKLALQLATGAEGVPFKFPDGLNVDQLTGDVYFTDASSVFQMRTFASLSNHRLSFIMMLNETNHKEWVRSLMMNLSIMKIDTTLKEYALAKPTKDSTTE
ncbi:protein STRICTOSIDINE SYNTHASE-LIKE 12-like [Humulus lupulus]|uniref:protein STRICTOSIDINE SYNTHASE-LIKE 12-like n=1 Tax=Humulus lupulus TaxID=3486 RepID=UPI002B40D11E|nr:protein STRICTOSIDINE SYNTHASE-LIKE 12-like [Humulus lupulus]